MSIANVYGEDVGSLGDATSSPSDALTAWFSDLPRAVLSDATAPTGSFTRPRRVSPAGHLVIPAAFLLASQLTAGVAVPTVDAVRATRQQFTVSSAAASSNRVGYFSEDPRVEAASPAELIRAIYARSGLTWDQVARLLGISRRAAHQWAAGSRVTARHHELLASAVSLIDRLYAGDPASTRAALLSPRGAKGTLFDEFRGSHRDPIDISGMPPAERAFTLAEP